MICAEILPLLRELCLSKALSLPSCTIPCAALLPAPVASSSLCIHTALVFQLCPLPAPAELCGALLLWPGALCGIHGVLLGPGLGQHALLHPGLPADGDLLRHDRQGQCREQLRGQQSLRAGNSGHTWPCLPLILTMLAFVIIF